MHKKTFLVLSVLLVAASLTLASDPSVLKFKIGHFSTANGMPSYAKLGLERAPKSTEADWYIVQFTGPVEDAWRSEVSRVGGKIHSDYIPNYGQIVKMNGEVRSKIEKLPFVQFVGYYQPAFRISPDLLSAPNFYAQDEPGRIMLNIALFDKEDLPSVGQKAKGMMDVRWLQEGGNIVQISLPSDRAVELSKEFANYPEVFWVERYYQPVLHNAWSRWINQSLDSTGMRAAADSWKSKLTINTADDSLKMPIYKRGLYGQGQIVGDDDTGMDWDNIYFRDASLKPVYDKDKDTICESTNAHRKIVAYNVHADTFDLTSSGHGSHTSGSIGADSLGWLTTQASLPRAMGMAPKCRIAFTDIGGASDALVLPTDYSVIYLWAYNAGARIHSSSWGQSAGGSSAYTLNCQQLDQVAWTHKNYAMFRSAGNSNTSGDRVNSPATGKNIICVGASESGFGSTATTWAVNGTADRNELLDVAEFSSHGPTDEGLRRPTLLGAGGWYIWSVDSDGSLTTNNTGIMTMGGTSMSTPTMAGMGALVRQYLTEGWYPTGTKVPANAIANPSGSLIKAMMMLATRNFNGAYSIDAVGQTGTQNLPSQGQGWGGVVLDDALFFAGDARKSALEDATVGFSSSGQSKTFTVTTGTSGTQTLKFVLSYFDYPGTPGATDITVNDLDLTVTGGGNTYYGNVFGQPASNGFSITGGAKDTVNCEEVVWLPASATKANVTYTVTVNARAINNGPQPYVLTVAGDIAASTGFTISPNAVEMTSFSAMAVNNTVEVRWRTESEKDCDHWLIERSTEESGNFAKLGEVTGHLTTNEPHQYVYTDASDLETGIYYYRLAEVDLSGVKTYYGPMLVEFGGKNLPLSYQLGKAYPNPAASSVTIRYALKNTGRTSIKVYNVLGQEVRTLLDGIQPAGHYSLPWDGKDSRGQKAANGVYLYQMTSGDFSATQKVMILR
ncbi:MAG: hypothetical protein A2509_06400 [Candidatus Edwardsbacteria bacterium RIFOXYD12_FULL_50_11]|uniref:FlgD Ig-like domain-containing protein n=1 Tax=Candidatus Edwardsbacteria bacterium GWF2_54_11 TaxID=1817851 RepID=A0A1F5R318_9BACT|nr:MAG: hypothetical protein A2502_10215 [Candidatus Edwardsbacteria bacterium RifOxyC12_full_54_24]OGF06788.1 MAG: hypothetical protein A2273_00845 [Candidatus Edwardsbacteria bacterium RifOxyA12_full_54_48]OGF08855.1 MAG: hypothetical protein A2024_01105 [Candidatus Edwardsbacteria bacterium GWF2_54_11]OGF10738.1 MAG: hypothetical protein A3K15_06210 [Candidatus Edwardsbacteria bacterium GWE2_54_12]OGF15518.1 MAG: hypothetical protein A2509_06400 [Candidatus Edwardsbacteria bacterium RIFOXYD1